MAGPNKFLGRVEAFLERTGMAPSRFGKLTCNDSNLLWQLRQGRELRRATEAAVVDFMRRHRGSKAGARRRTPSKPQRSPKPSRASHARQAVSPVL